ncbi:MAG: sulfite oxidase-like oxidoreductase [Gemmatimonadales bacterium]|nr:sulfite oxidase-like oxidoreductase [Gemmatimonadales bacterium]
MTEAPRRVIAKPPAERLPPGQIETKKWPVLHYGQVPLVDSAAWRFRVTGLVENPLTLAWDDLAPFPRQETVCDIHCVTRWSRYDNLFTGIPVRAILALAKPLPEATFVLVHAEPDFTTNLPIGDLDRQENLLATHHNGEPLTPDHGGPIRLLVPHLYFWKSAKWVTSFEFMNEDWPGFWEQNGYHMRGDPWGEERYGRPDYARMRRGPRRG